VSHYILIYFHIWGGMGVWGNLPRGARLPKLLELPDYRSLSSLLLDSGVRYRQNRQRRKHQTISTWFGAFFYGIILQRIKWMFCDVQIEDLFSETLGVRHHQKTKRAFCTCGKYNELQRGSLKIICF
jgi:hypothetical protein